MPLRNIDSYKHSTLHTHTSRTHMHTHTIICFLMTRVYKSCSQKHRNIENGREKAPNSEPLMATEFTYFLLRALSTHYKRLKINVVNTHDKPNSRPSTQESTCYPDLGF